MTLKIIHSFALVTTIFLQGCITIGNEFRGSNSKKRTHIGLVVVEHLPGDRGLTYTKYISGGAWIEKNGAGIGLKSQLLISANPKCQVIFIIKTKEQLEHAEMLLRPILDKNEGTICLEKQ